MWQDMMSWMPSESKQRSPGDVLSRFVEYEASPTFSLLPLSLRATVAAAKAFVASVHRGIPPVQIKEATGNMKKFAERTMGSGWSEGSLSTKPSLRKLRFFFSGESDTWRFGCGVMCSGAGGFRPQDGLFHSGDSGR